MPVYAYSCASCHSDFDEFATVSERHNVTCRKCGKLATKQVSGVTTLGDRDDFTTEPGGARWNHQLQTHVTSVAHAEELGKRRGWHAVDH